MKVWVGGVVVSRQRPPTARGTAFLALEDEGPVLSAALSSSKGEDEGGLINVVLRAKVYETSRKALKSPFVVVEGRLQRRSQEIGVLARRVVVVDPSVSLRTGVEGWEV